MKKMCLFFLILLSSQCWAGLYLNISIYNKKGIDLGLTLASELHSIEEVHEGEEITMQMRNGIRLVLKASFSKEIETYGPSSKVIIRGHILGKNGEVLTDFKKNAVFISLGEERSIFHNKETQLIEVKIMPEAK